ncbi:MAG: hypothetical protein HY841_02290 [Bacteroidetes bacterium]|nr:hypothetical protein [Bacteroidota bacterium]
MKTHIGNKIKELLDEKKMSVREFAKLIDVTPNSVYVMLKKDLLNPKWIEIISEALGYDLYQHAYAPSAGSSAANTQTTLNTLREENESLKKQNEDMKKEIAYLKEINELLKKGKTK